MSSSSSPALLHERVGQMSSKVYTESDGNDDVSRGHDVNGEAPKVHETADVCLKLLNTVILLS